MNKFWLSAAALSAALSVVFGAFAAHALKQVLDEKALAVFETGVRYQFYHSFALFLCGIMAREGITPALKWAYRLFALGMLLFCISLYLLALFMPQHRWLGAIIPFGGLAFIFGWLLLFMHIQKNRWKV